jgi:hypothetical protein
MMGRGNTRNIYSFAPEINLEISASVSFNGKVRQAMSEDSATWSVCPSGNCDVKTQTGVEHWENYTDSSTGINPSITDSLCTTKATRTDLDSNPGFRAKKPITNLLSDGTN